MTFRQSRVVIPAIVSLFLTGCLKRTLVTDISESEAREVAVALYQGDVRTHVVKQPKTRGQDDNKFQVDIDGGDRTQVEAWRILQENGLPRHAEAGIQEVYKDSQLVPTASEERAKLLLALSGELSRSLKTIPGVVDARVHVALPDPSVLRVADDKPHATASVLLTYWSNYPEPKEDKVRELIANGVEGLDRNNISLYAEKLQPPSHQPMEDFTNAVRPTVGLVLDYAYLGATILSVIIAIRIGFGIAPGIVRWFRTQVSLVRG
jgi:type III secretion protein J